VLGAKIGAGGMGVVHRARDERLARDVAIKLLPFHDADRLRRFAAEAKAAAALSHPNVLQIFDVQIEGDQPYLVMELLEGRTLSELLLDGKLPLRRALSLAAQAARGLAAAHARNIVHRDLKPLNLFVTRDDVVKLLDFGLAKVTQPVSAHGETHDAGGTSSANTAEGAVLGTVGYMAPEQVQGRPADARSDLFAFGCVLYEMLAGQRAFHGPTPVETSYKVLRDDPAPLPESVPAPITRIVQRCLAKEPAERLQSARDLAFLLDDLSQVSSSSTTMAPLVAPPRRRRGLTILGALALAGASFAGAWLAHGRAPRPSVPSFHELTTRTGGFSNARFTPDGKTVLFSARMGGSPFRVYLTSPGVTEPRALSSDGVALFAVSSTGELAVLLDAHTSPHGTGTAGTLARGALAGGTPRPLLEHAVAADWSPDGSQLAVIRYVDGKHRLEYPLGHTIYESVNALHGLRISPDGRELALYEIVRGAGAYWGTVLVLDNEGKRRRASRALDFLGGYAVWHGTDVLVSAAQSGGRRRLIAIAPDGSDRTLMETPVDFSVFDLAPDGRMVGTGGWLRREAAFTYGDAPLRTMSLPGTAVPKALSADGKLILMTLKTDAGNQVFFLQASGELVHLVKGEAFALSRDGQFVLFAAGLPDSQIGITPTGAGETRMLPRGALDRYTTGTFTADGKQVVFVGAEAGQPFRIWVQDLAGGLPRALTAAGESVRPDGAVLCSPDGAFVYFHDLEGARKIALAGGASTRVPGVGTRDPLIQLSADSTQVFVRHIRADRTRAEIDQLDLSTGAMRPWRTLAPPPEEGNIGTEPLIAPGGDAYGYFVTRGDYLLFAIDGVF
jgi:serine/threonine protein kinase